MRYRATLKMWKLKENNNKHLKSVSVIAHYVKAIGKSEQYGANSTALICCGLVVQLVVQFVARFTVFVQRVVQGFLVDSLFSLLYNLSYNQINFQPNETVEIGSNYITLICCGFVVQQTVQQIHAQQIGVSEV